MMRAWVSDLAEASIRLTRAWAWARSALPFSAAARPSAIFWRRSSIAFVRGGHTNFIVNQPRTKNTSIWKKIVAFRFTVVPLTPCGSGRTNGVAELSILCRPAAERFRCRRRQARLHAGGRCHEPPGSAHERVGEGEQHGDTHADQERRVDQASQQEHLGLQRIHQFGLTSRSFQVLAAHQCDTDASADGAQTDDKTASESNESDVGHDNSLVRNLKSNCKKTGTAWYARKSCAPAWASARARKTGSMPFVSLADVHQRQHHEDESLQQHDQDVED